MIRIAIVLVAAAAVCGPAHAQSDKSNCKAVLAPIVTAASAYRSIMTEVNELAVNNLVSGLSGEEQAKAQALAEAHEALRPILKAYVERLEDMAYALQTCIR